MRMMRRPVGTSPGTPPTTGGTLLQVTLDLQSQNHYHRGWPCAFLSDFQGDFFFKGDSCLYVMCASDTGSLL